MNILKFKNQSILVKLSLLIVVSLVPILVILSTVILPEVEQQWYQNKYDATKNTVEAVFNTLEYFNKKVNAIDYTEEDAKRDAAELLKAQRYEGNNYFWINDTDVKIVAHPLRQEREGKDVSNLQDANGKRIYIEFVKACNNSNGEGFVRYDQNKPGVDEPQPKLSYVKLYKPWGWIVGSGVYLNSVEESVDALNSSIYKVIGLAVLIASIIGFIIAKFISKPILQLNEAAEKVADGDLNVKVSHESESEIGKLSSNFNKMTLSIKENIEKARNKELEANQKAHEAEEAKRLSENQKSYLSESVGKILAEMEKLSNGDLTVKLDVTSQDEIGRLFNGFNLAVEKIKNIITKVVELSSSTTSSTNVINLRTEEMASGSQEQSVQITDVAGAVEEMTTNIHSTTQHSNIATEKAKTAGNIAKEGGKVVSDTVKGMNAIASIVDSAAQKVNTLGENSKQIGEIIQVIDEIADQTNLLALNAAIEAARAGEQGRGFAVVADEVRKLAERTTNATKEIAEMIKRIQLDTLDAVNSINAGTKEVENGKQLADQAGQSLEQIIKGSEEVVSVIAQVAMATEEQASAAAIISQNLVGISTATEENTQNIQEIAGSVEQLNSLTDTLNELVNEFKLSSEYSTKQFKLSKQKVGSFS